MIMNFENLAANLPDAFAKSENSNNYKLLKLGTETTDKIEETLKTMLDMLDIDNASGETLDLWFGKRYVLERGTSTDEQYRIRLTGKMMQNTSDGSHPSLVEALALILQCKKSDIHIIETQNRHGVIIKNIPLKIISDAGFSVEEILDIIQDLLPAGVFIKEYSLSGTFELGEIGDYNENTGLSDADRTIGGYLGLLEKEVNNHGDQV